MLFIFLPLRVLSVSTSRVMLADLIPLLYMHLLLLLSSELLQEADIIVGARSVLSHQRGGVLNGGRVLWLILMMLCWRLIKHGSVVAQLTGAMRYFSRVTLGADLVMLATVQLLVSLDHLISLELQLELLEAHVLLGVVCSGVACTVILISLQHLLLEAVVHLLHELLAALASFKRLVGH